MFIKSVEEERKQNYNIHEKIDRMPYLCNIIKNSMVVVPTLTENFKAGGSLSVNHHTLDESYDQKISRPVD